MAAWIGDSPIVHGPLVLSTHDAAAWNALRARARTELAPYQRGPKGAPPVVVDLDGPVLVLPTGRETAWHPRPWGGFLARMLQLENVIAQDAGATWKPDGTAGLTPIGATFRATGPLHFIDLALGRDAVGEATLAVELAAGEYHVEVADNVAPDRRRIFQVIRLRRVGVDLTARPAHTKEKPAARAGASASTAPAADGWLDAPATAESRKLARGLRLAESEGAELLLVSGDDYAKGKRGIVLGSPDPSGFLVHGGHVLIYRQLAADDRARAVAVALAVPEKKWKKTRKEVVVGKSRTLYLVDGDADPAEILARKRLGDDATRLEVAPGTYALSTAGEVHAADAVLELHRLTRR
jgi:hypothetical protein